MNFPPDFIAEMKSMMCADEVDELLSSLRETPTTSIRLNPKKANRVMTDFGACESVPWCEWGRYLADRPSFTMDPLFHAGAYYVQEASSMFIAHLLQQYVGKRPVTALDLCAAPGGKSTLMLSCLSDDSQLMANEIVQKRAWILRENLTKWGADNVFVTNNRAEDFHRLEEVFDLILCDVPCSGEGMFRKDEVAIQEWSAKNVEMCARRQRDILTSIWHCLRPSGLLIYSTCTFNTLEDEDNVDWIATHLGADILPCHALPEWNITGNMTGGDFDCCHFFPHKNKGEGFFCAVLRKKGDEAEEERGRIVLTERHLKGLRLLNAEAQPQHVGQCEVDRTTALRYLHGEAIILPPDIPRDIIQITYQQLPLGLVKNIGNRANNLYPKEWRIRKMI